MKMTRVTAEEKFLQAFDKTIHTVYRQLASSGVDDDAIWAAFRRATTVMANLSNDVEDEHLPRIPKRHKAHAARRPQRTAIGN